MQCPTCGKENNESDKFCIYCGAVVRYAGTPLSAFSPEEIAQKRAEVRRQRRRGIIWISASVLSLPIILSAYAIVFFILRQYGVDPTPEASVVATIFKLVRVVLSLLGIIAVMGIPIGIVIGVSYLRKETIFPGEPYDERSGKGELSELPPEIQKWSWGAAGLTWIWGAYHRVWRSFWIFLPLLNYFYWIYLGLKGNELAWRKNRWRSVSEFLAFQRKWRNWGIAIFIFGAVFFGLQILVNIAELKNKPARNEAATNIVRDAIYNTATARPGDKKYADALRKVLVYVKTESNNLLPTDKKLGDSDILELSSYASKASVAGKISDLEKAIKEIDNFEPGFERMLANAKNLFRESGLSDREERDAIRSFESAVNDQEQNRLRKARLLAMKNAYQKTLELYQFVYKNFDNYEVILDGKEEGINFTTDVLIDEYNLLLSAVRQTNLEYEKADQALIGYLNNRYQKGGININADELRDFMTK